MNHLRRALRWWPWPPLAVTTFAAVRHTTWEWVTGLAASWVLFTAWQRRRARARQQRARLDALIGTARQQAGIAEQAARRDSGMPAGHPEKLTACLGRADEERLEWLADQTWPDAEYETEIEMFGRGEAQ